MVGVWIGLFIVACSAVGAVNHWLKRAEQQRIAGAVYIHKKNLKKGGLIPRVESSIHQLALTELGQENPNLRLPRAQYFNKD